MPMHHKAVSTFGVLVLVAALGWSASPAAASPDLTAVPASVDFGPIDVHPQNPSSATQSVTLSNTTDADVVVGPATLIGADPASFQIVGNADCGTIGPSGTCVLQVQLIGVGPASAVLTLEDPSGFTNVSLSGDGLTGTVAANPDRAGFEERPYSFGGQNANFQLQVNGAGVRTTSASITGPGASAFSISYGSNCFDQLFFANNSCGFGVAFNPTGPATYVANLEILSDGSPDPLIVPLTTRALSGPHLRLTPSRLAFGDVPVGQALSATVTVLNDGDYAGQVGETLTVTGLPDVFAVTGDTCEGRIIPRGASCAVTVRFQPAFAGPVNASLFLIAGDGRRPVEVVGLNGTGVGGPAPPGPPSVALSGRAVADRALRCVPSAPASAYAWLRNGVAVRGAIGSTLTPRDADVGARFACRARIGAVTVASARSGPVRPRNLEGLGGAFVDAVVCRSVGAPAALHPGRRTVRIAAGAPVTARAPLVLRATAAVGVSIDGRVVGSGRRVAVSPRTLARLGNGGHALRVAAGGASATGTLSLSSCGLALQVTGGPGRTSAVAVSARYGVPSIAVRLSGLRLALGHRFLGQLSYDQAGLPRRTLELVGARSSANGVTVALRRGRLVVTGLPPEVGVVRLRLRPGVLDGARGSGVAMATLRGSAAPTTAQARAAWTP